MADIMTREPVAFSPDMPLRAAAKLLFEADFSGAPVVDDAGELVGVLSEHDLLEKEAHPRYGLRRGVMESHRRHDASTVGEVCSRPALTIAPDASVHNVARQLIDRRVTRLIVVDSGRVVVGIVTRHDVLRSLTRPDAELRAAVGAVLAEAGEPDVEPNVESGVVTLEGKAQRRSRVPAIVRRAADIDGVITVHERLGWRTDDVGLPQL
ncbi:MAG: CBS domain-containing protein [Egibacteraceae bacterium]